MAEWKRITSEDDPERCQGVDGTGQCKYQRMPPSDFCPRHGGNKAAQAAKKEAVRNFQLTIWKSRLEQFADNPQIKSLREEIGICRLTLEATLNKCQTETDLILYQEKIGRMVEQLRKLIESCHRIEERSGQLLDKQTIFIICDSLVKVIADHIEDGDILDQIAGQMVDIITRVGGGGAASVTANAGAIPG